VYVVKADADSLGKSAAAETPANDDPGAAACCGE
jgi:hypothetical protein